MDSSRGTTKKHKRCQYAARPRKLGATRKHQKTISSRKRPNVDATRAAGSPGKSAAMIQQASRNSAASTRNKETAKNQQAAEKAPVAGMAILISPANYLTTVPREWCRSYGKDSKQWRKQNACFMLHCSSLSHKIATRRSQVRFMNSC